MKNASINSERLSNLDLIRIVAMLLIILSHALTYGGVIENAGLFSFQYYFATVLKGISRLAINLFVLVSGYFLYKSEFKLHKLILLISPVFFYSVIIYFVLSTTGIIDFSISGVVYSIFPTTLGLYWFVTVYVGLLVLSPFLNIALNALTKKQHFILLLTLFLLFSVWSTLTVFTTTLNFGRGNGVVWLIVVYCFGAYFRRFKQDFILKKRGKPLILFIILILLVPVSKFCISYLINTPITSFVSASVLINGSDTFMLRNSFLSFVASLLCFILFLNIKIKSTKSKKVISFVSPLIFGVYLIHDNQYLRTVLWKLINMPYHMQKIYFPVYLLIVVVTIFVICIIIEWGRQRLFKLVGYEAFLIKKCEKVTAWLDRLLDKYLVKKQ